MELKAAADSFSGHGVLLFKGERERELRGRERSIGGRRRERAGGRGRREVGEDEVLRGSMFTRGRARASGARGGRCLGRGWRAREESTGVGPSLGEAWSGECVGGGPAIHVIDPRD